MKFRTQINDFNSSFKINHKDKILLLGSCFSDNIFDKLNKSKFNTLSNPFGIIYNPISINKIFNSVINLDFPLQRDLIQRDELWHHFDFHSEMSGIKSNEVLLRLKVLMNATKDFISKANYIFITYGTSTIHTRVDNNQIVANNHKFPSSFFAKSRLSIDQIVTSTTDTINKINELNSNAKIIFTVSPVRHIKDGIHENQISKATLLLAIDKLVNNIDTFYFPSYELLLDDLRDYRFYSKDLIHPSEIAIDYIWKKFSDYFFNTNTKQKITEIEKLTKALEHSPFNPNTKTHQDFLSNLQEKIKLFEKNNPEINFT